MMDWKKTVSAVAPMLGKAISVVNPMAGLAVQAVSTALLDKPDGNEDEIAAAVASANPETLLKLKTAEQQFAKDMKQLDVDIYNIDKDDRDSARKREIALGGYSNKFLLQRWSSVSLRSYTQLSMIRVC